MPRTRRPYMATREKPPRRPDDFKEKPPISARGRPSEYSIELGQTICERLVEGETLRKICLDPEMPSRSTIFVWLTRHNEFLERYKIAIELHADYWADMAQDIASDRVGDYIEKDGKLIPDWENVQRSRLRVDTIKWRTAKLNPKKYSDRFQMSGPDEKPLPSQTLTDEQRVVALKSLLKKMKLRVDESEGGAMQSLSEETI